MSRAVRLVSPVTAASDPLSGRRRSHAAMIRRRDTPGALTRRGYEPLATGAASPRSSEGGRGRYRWRKELRARPAPTPCPFLSYDPSVREAVGERVTDDLGVGGEAHLLAQP